MPKTKRSCTEISPVHANATAIDIGATLHVAAVGPDRDPEPVRSFGTFTGDLHRLADWFKQCGVTTVAMESTGVLLDPSLRDSGTARLHRAAGECPRCEACTRPQDRRDRRSTAIFRAVAVTALALPIRPAKRR
jgi:hypothetical protein